MVRIFVVFCAAFPLAAQARASTLLLGDSLAVGIAPYVHIKHLRVDARIGRTTAEGMDALASYPHQDRLMISLFTNDYPADLGGLQSAVRYSLRRATCAVWATLYRRHENFSLENRYLRRHARGRFQLVDWSRFVRRHPGLIAPDGTHATAAGYRARAHLYVTALRRCPN